MLAHHYLQALERRPPQGENLAFADAARKALTDAGDRVVALNAHQAAARFFRAALDLLPEADPAHGRRCPARPRACRVGRDRLDMLGRARDELLSAGDDEGAQMPRHRCASSTGRSATTTLRWRIGPARRLVGSFRRPAPRHS